MFVHKKRNSLYHYIAYIGGIFALVQACFWILLTSAGITCMFTKCGKNQNDPRISKAFFELYFNKETSLNYPTISPVCFHILLWIYLIASIILLILSWQLIVVCKVWLSGTRKKIPKLWSIYVLLLCCLDFIVFIIFVRDFYLLNKMTLIPLNKNVTQMRQSYDLNSSSTTPENPFITYVPMLGSTDAEFINTADLHDYNIMTGGPPAISMTVAIRGYLVWITNCTFAIVLLLVIYERRKRRRSSLALQSLENFGSLSKNESNASKKETN